MARSRNIKPGFFTNDELAECSPYARLLFAGLWTISDKEGRLDDRPKKIKALVLPFDSVDCDDLLAQLHAKNFITRYVVEGNGYIQINNWKKHQNPHCKEAASDIPELSKQESSSEEAPEKPGTNMVKLSDEPSQPIEINEAPEMHGARTVQEQCENNLNPADSLNLIPDSLNLIPFNTQAAEAPCQEDDIPDEHSQENVHEMASRYAFEGNIVRLNHKDYESWKKLFPNIDLISELQRLDIEFSHEKPKNWFTTASAKLNYQNKQATKQPAWGSQRRVAGISQPMNFIPEGFTG
ncbi:hypothetical protein MUA04_00950 [Enterobacteriaceae bacterium H11S18]|uniref:hypothetical protein n=1 Tax=Dryocola clanedunensis TaxID=2925396 RepID=UPI0022F10021|nr:hypothetical protein [Dryocola clanedunensis]MCT4708804.1 hypothetical protein [Dryocola clanedunensis]